MKSIITNGVKITTHTKITPIYVKVLETAFFTVISLLLINFSEIDYGEYQAH